MKGLALLTFFVLFSTLIEAKYEIIFFFIELLVENDAYIDLGTFRIRKFNRSWYILRKMFRFKNKNFSFQHCFFRCFWNKKGSNKRLHSLIWSIQLIRRSIQKALWQYFGKCVCLCIWKILRKNSAIRPRFIKFNDSLWNLSNTTSSSSCQWLCFYGWRWFFTTIHARKWKMESWRLGIKRWCESHWR